MNIINATQHYASEEQKALGVIDLPPFFREEMVKLITFDQCPTFEQIIQRANDVIMLLESFLDYSNLPHNAYVMIGGAPFFRLSLAKALHVNGMQPIYAFSERKSFEKEVGGKIEKTSQFVHTGG